MSASSQSLITSTFIKTTDSKRKIADTSMDGSVEEAVEIDEGAKRHNELLELLKGIQGSVSNLTTRFDNLESRVNSITVKYEEQNTQINNLLHRNTALQAENVEIRAEINKLRRDLDIESSKRDQLENQDRKYNLEISGVPFRRDEEPKELVAKVMGVAGAGAYGEADIDIAHRKMAGGIIVRFHSRTVRNDVYDKRFNLQGKTSLDLGLGFTEKNDLYLNESLTFDRSVLMKEVRDELKVYNKNLPKDDKLKVKTQQGYIKVRDKSGDYQKINKIEDVKAIIRT